MMTKWGEIRHKEDWRAVFKQKVIEVVGQAVSLHRAAGLSREHAVKAAAEELVTVYEAVLSADAERSAAARALEPVKLPPADGDVSAQG